MWVFFVDDCFPCAPTNFVAQSTETILQEVRMLLFLVGDDGRAGTLLQNVFPEHQARVSRVYSAPALLIAAESGIVYDKVFIDAMLNGRDTFSFVEQFLNGSYPHLRQTLVLLMAEGPVSFAECQRFESSRGNLVVMEKAVFLKTLDFYVQCRTNKSPLS